MSPILLSLEGNSVLSRRYPKHPLVGVGAVVLIEDKVLLVRRAAPPGKGKWSIPGGLVELGESLSNAAVRELYEETGIRAKPLGVIDVEEYIERDVRGRIVYHYVIIDILVEPLGELRPHAQSDALEVGLFSISDALELELTSSTRKFLRKLLESNVHPSIIEL